MQVRIHFAVPRDRMEVFVFVDDMDGKKYVTADDNIHDIEPEGAEPFATFPIQVWEMLVERIVSGERGPATERHLNDSTATRDRLLALVELGFREHVAPSESLNPLNEGPGKDRG